MTAQTLYFLATSSVNCSSQKSPITFSFAISIPGSSSCSEITIGLNPFSMTFWINGTWREPAPSTNMFFVLSIDNSIYCVTNKINLLQC